MKISKLVLEGEKALVYGLFGSVKEVKGPKRLWPWQSLEEFSRVTVPEGESGYYIDEKGKLNRVQGPAVVFVHPDGGKYIPDERIDLMSYEVVVVWDENGKHKIYHGNKENESTVWITARQRLHTFVWTGSESPREGREEKLPGHLKINRLRLQDTQTYMTIPVRTADSIVLEVKLTLDYSYNENVNLLLENNDPLAVLFNRVTARVVEAFASKKFDDIKTEVGKFVADLPVFKSDSDDNKSIAKIGVLLKSAVVRSWEPKDAKVSQVLSQAGMVQTQKALDQAEHERVMLKLSSEEAERLATANLNELRLKESVEEGKREGQKFAQILKEVSEVVKGDKDLLTLAALQQASKAETLVLGDSFLKR